MKTILCAIVICFLLLVSLVDAQLKGQIGDVTGIDKMINDLQAATCSDGIKNGDETDVDCGGSCQPCPKQVPPPKERSGKSGLRNLPGEILTSTPAMGELTTVGDEVAGVGGSGQKRLGGLGGLERPGELAQPERRYKAEAVGFKCIDETGYDFLGSDEVVFVFEAMHYIEVIDVFEDVDAGELRTFESNKRCILPVEGNSHQIPFGDVFGGQTCLDTGVPGPVSFKVKLWEVDEIFYGGGGDFPPGNATSKLIGSATISHTAKELAEATPLIGSLLQKTIDLGPCYDERGCVTSPGTPNDAHYTFTYKITRLPDYLPERQS